MMTATMMTATMMTARTMTAPDRWVTGGLVVLARAAKPCCSKSCNQCQHLFSCCRHRCYQHRRHRNWHCYVQSLTQIWRKVTQSSAWWNSPSCTQSKIPLLCFCAQSLRVSDHRRESGTWLLSKGLDCRLHLIWVETQILRAGFCEIVKTCQISTFQLAPCKI